MSRAGGAAVYGNRIRIEWCSGITRREKIATASVNIDMDAPYMASIAFSGTLSNTPSLKSTQMRRYRINGKGKRVLAALRDSGQPHLLLDRKQLFLMCQPQMEIFTGRIVGAEALLR